MFLISIDIIISLLVSVYLHNSNISNMMNNGIMIDSRIMMGM